MWCGSGGKAIFGTEKKREAKKSFYPASQVKGSAETQRVRLGRGSSIITDILTVQKAPGIRNPGNALATLNTEHSSLTDLILKTTKCVLKKLF